jgi:hypothetical protein
VYIYIYINSLVFRRSCRKGVREGIGASSRPVGTVNWESCADGPFKDHGTAPKNPSAIDVLKQSPIQHYLTIYCGSSGIKSDI